MTKTTLDKATFFRFNITLFFFSLVVEAYHHLLVFRKFWLQLPFQYDLHIPVLQNARRNQVSSLRFVIRPALITFENCDALSFLLFFLI